MDSRITIQTRTTADDYKALVFFTIYKRNQFLFYFIIAVAVFALAAVLASLTGIISIPGWYYAVCLAFWALIALNYLVYLYTVKRFLASDKFTIDRELTVKIDETGLTSEDEKAENFASYKWDQFYKAYDTKKYFLLYLNTAMALVLPKKDFGAEEIPVMEKLVRDKLGNKYKKR